MVCCYDSSWGCLLILQFCHSLGARLWLSVWFSPGSPHICLSDPHTFPMMKVRELPKVTQIFCLPEI
jgi:hypothetical protein